MYKANIKTTLGDITISLNDEKAPISVKNFLTYIKEDFYTDTLFHRVIDGFMIQGGGLTTGLKNKTSTIAPIENEANNGLKNNIYTIAMARTNDPHSATSQFFINVADNEFLNYSAPTLNGWGYAVFGEVISGKDTINKIKSARTNTIGFHQNVPVEDIVIQSVDIIE
ncbi:peptidyl-prolyl cis-trans isomerase B [Candidatus Kinetoplastibacterium desouzaii TCC079E]|uniref:Peptidyl-prolyl cis-trans isomerase n=1 Tax=Candidatus Kinetoplastidibacterium desouzai TCC079E TaxID=1208919 RepID=M1L1U1_9PROT|nr:peptidylprolyl isomerase [Candidatus Kinetoplastibacterium desouzaii]AGF46718.1 peptidyl-prolyl cis-trans isomerase B [Candidatus Kinetoplastibacterium desouzaii TCC079E]